MKKITLLLAALSFSLTMTAQVKWLEGVHDFGAFDEDDGKVTCSFRFVNESAQPVAVVSARPSCGCTVPKIPRHSIAPGDTASVDVTFDPTGRPGRFEKNVKVQLSDAGDSKFTLRIKGVVIGNSNTLRSRYPVDAAPMKLRGRIVAFGEVTPLRAKSQTVEIYNASQDTIRPEWSAVPPYIRIASVSPAIPPGEQSAYAVTIVPDKAGVYGLLTDSVSIRATAGSEPVWLDVIANISEDFSHLTDKQLADAPHARTPRRGVDLGEIPAGSAPIKTSFEIENTGKNPLIIRRVYSADPGVTATVDATKLKKGKKAVARVEIDPSRLQSEVVNVRVSVITNDPSRPNQIVRIVGEIK